MSVDTSQGIDVKALPAKRRVPAAKISHQINVGNDILSAISASINSVEPTAAWQPPVVTPGQKLGGKEANSADARVKAAATVEKKPAAATMRWASDEMRGSMAPLRRPPGVWRGAINPAFDWQNNLWAPKAALPQIRDVSDIPSIMAPPRVDLWARPREDMTDPHAEVVRIGGSSCETAALSLAERRAIADKSQVRTAYLLWLLLGHVGAHHFYLNRVVSGLIYMLITLFGVILYRAGQGIWYLIPIWAMLAADSFLMRSYVRGSSGSFWGI